MGGVCWGLGGIMLVCVLCCMGWIAKGKYRWGLGTCQFGV
jgi:hypothetical protein